MESPDSDPIEDIPNTKPHQIPLPKDMFSMPSNELRRQKKEENDKLDSLIE